MPAAAVTRKLRRYAFNGCKVLTKINSDNIGEIVVSNIGTISIGTFYSTLAITKVIIPEGVQAIGDFAFSDMKSLKEVVAPTSLESIGIGAFEGDVNLTKFNSLMEGELIIPNKITSISSMAFEGCALVTKLVVPDNVQTIGNAAFKGCNSLQDVTLPFVGESISATNYDAVFGYIFGYSTKFVSDRKGYSTEYYDHPTMGDQSANEVMQYSCYNQNNSGYNNYSLRQYYYFIPHTITKVTITKQTEIPVAAFNKCQYITDIILPSSI